MELNRADIEKIGKMPMNFVAGKERSGTTLLQIMLNGHPHISAPPESRFIMLQYSRYGHIQQWTEQNLRDFINEIYYEGLFKTQWKLDKKELLATLLPVCQYLSYSLLCKSIYYLFAAPGKQITVLFDKNPVYYYFLPKLEQIFPEAKFIHLVRDYRANIVSHRRVFRIKSPADLAYRWMGVNKIIEERKKLSPNKYTLLRYEDLVTNPVKSMKDVCAFIGIEYDAGMNRDHTTSLTTKFAEEKTERFLKVHGSLLQPVNTTHVEEWKDKLSPAETAEAEAIAGNYAEKMYGYKPTQPPIKITSLRMLDIKARYLAIKSLYRFVFKRLSLYYYIKRNVWNDF